MPPCNKRYCQGVDNSTGELCMCCADLPAWRAKGVEMKDLCAMIILRALVDLNSVVPSIQQSAHNWIFTDDYDSDNSFFNLCKETDMNCNKIRSMIKSGWKWSWKGNPYGNPKKDKEEKED